MMPVLIIVLAAAVVYGGRVVNARVAVLDRNNIPAPVVGGLVFAVASLLAHSTGWRHGGLIGGDLRHALEALLPFFMIATFASVGLNASIRLLIEGGRGVVLFLAVATLLLLAQNTVGVTMAMLVGLDAPFGLLAGSITLSGGHDTGFAWSEVFRDAYGLSAAREVAFVCATFGLIAGGLLGGRIVRLLMERHGITPPAATKSKTQNPQKSGASDEHNDTHHLFAHITALLVCVLAAFAMSQVVGKGGVIDVTMPSFIWAIVAGVIIRNGADYFGWYRFDTALIAVLGGVALAFFLGLAMMSLKLWQLASLATPLLVILTAQVVMMAVFAFFVTYRVMGGGYDAAVIAGGHCGFGMGATPTALAIIHAVGEKYAVSAKALLVVPLVGAFFIDIMNAIIIQGFLWAVG